MHHFDVPHKAQAGRSLWGRFGLRLFFYRYKLLESANFPFLTYDNGVALVVLGASLYFSISLFHTTTTATTLGLWILSVVLAFLSTMHLLFWGLVFTAPTVGRLSLIRRAYITSVHYLLCGFMGSKEWCTGANLSGYMMHLPVSKLLSYGYLSADELEYACSLAIVRNPYSRMVSMYHYNRFGSRESFGHFVKDWYRRSHKAYRERGELDEWWTPCHAIPQFEFTHYQGKQLVQSIVKQEELKLIQKNSHSEHDVEQGSSTTSSCCTTTQTALPTPVRDAILGLPHTNSRQTTKKWYDYFDQETLDLTYEMYQQDFEVFDYEPILAQRPDLQPPALYLQQQQQQVEEESVSKQDDTIPLQGMLRDSRSTASCSEATPSERVQLIRLASDHEVDPGSPFPSTHKLCPDNNKNTTADTTADDSGSLLTDESDDSDSNQDFSA